MIGAIIGDIAGSPYEGDRLTVDRRDYHPFFLYGVAKFTDDTNLTIAVADSLLTGVPFHEKFIEWYKKNPNLGYGSSFVEWAEKGGNYKNDSRGNGAVMRISPIALWALNREFVNNEGNMVPMTIEDQLAWAYKQVSDSTEWTHNCEEARNGALAAVTAMIMAGYRTEKGDRYDKAEIQQTVSKLSGYDLTPDVETVRNEWSKRDVRCNITVPQALICFFESTSFEDAIRLSIYSKGDTDTVAAIAGAIAEHYYGVESINLGILAETKMRLPPEMVSIVDQSYGGFLKW